MPEGPNGAPRVRSPEGSLGKNKYTGKVPCCFIRIYVHVISEVHKDG